MPPKPATAPRATARIEVFRPGTFMPMQGAPITYSAADLRAVADAYDPATAPAPIVVGHPETDAPAFGWVESFEYDAGAERLVANLHEIEPLFAELVKAGRYRKVSMAFFAPGQPHNPVPGTWYPKHVGFLGAAAPAVSGLKNAHFAGAAGATFTTSFGTGAQAASIFRRIRDWIIDRDGLEAADKVLPAWEIDWLDEADAPRSPAYAAPAMPPEPEPEPEEDPAVKDQQDPAFAARDAALTQREAEIAAREAAQNHADNVAFAEKLVTAGRLIPASRDKVVALLDALPGEASVAFAAGAAKLSPGAALREVLEAQPKVVSFGALDLGADPDDARGAAFAADGKAVDPARLALHHAAEAFMRAHPGTSYIDAVKAVG